MLLQFLLTLPLSLAKPLSLSDDCQLFHESKEFLHLDHQPSEPSLLGSVCECFHRGLQLPPLDSVRRLENASVGIDCRPGETFAFFVVGKGDAPCDWNRSSSEKSRASLAVVQGPDAKLHIVSHAFLLNSSKSTDITTVCSLPIDKEYRNRWESFCLESGRNATGRDGDHCERRQRQRGVNTELLSLVAFFCISVTVCTVRNCLYRQCKTESVSDREDAVLNDVEFETSSGY